MTDGANARPPGLDTKRPLSFFVTVYEVLVRPDLFFTRFHSRELDNTTSPAVFAVVCSVLSALFSALVLLLTPFRPVAGSMLGEDRFAIGIGLLVTLVLVVVLSLIALAVGTVVQHLITLPFIRYGEGIRATFVVVAYGANSILLLSWIPFIGYIALLYGIYVAAMGLREVHGTTTGRAFVPALLFGALLILLHWPETLFSAQF